MTAAVTSVGSSGEMTGSLSSSEIGKELGALIDPSRILTREIDRIAFASDASLFLKRSFSRSILKKYVNSSASATK